MAEGSASGRPLTSVPSYSNDASSSSTESKQSTTTQSSVSSDRDQFVPHVFDFVTLMNHAARDLRLVIPPLFLLPQAIDAGTLIGNGASFSAFRRSLPEGQCLQHESNMNGLVIRISPALQKRPKFVVYKVARIKFTGEGEPTPDTRRAMDAAMMEFYSLVHPPLLNHPNIIDILGLAWGSNYYNPAHKLPIAIVEYADHGTLQDLQKTESLSSSLRLSLCLDVAEGLRILHRCGIIHGDVKSENMLVFSHPEKRYIAKIADFGFSIVREAAGSEINIGGTRPWKAPETKSPVLKDLLKHTDIYSFGLLVWRVAANGDIPFAYCGCTAGPGEEYYAEIERLKQEDSVLEKITLEHWLVDYISGSGSSERSSLTTSFMDSLPSKLEAILAHLQSTDYNLGQLMQFLKGVFHTVPLMSQFFGPQILKLAHKDIFYGKIQDIAASCLGRDPNSRDLEAAIGILKGLPVEEQRFPERIGNVDILLRTGHDHHRLSWQQMRDLEPSVQAFIFQQYRGRELANQQRNRIHPPECFILASQYINGYGTEINPKEAQRLILHAAQWGDQMSRAYSFRICRALDSDFQLNDSIKRYVGEEALNGSRMALFDMQETDPDIYPKAKEILRNMLAGVGAQYFTGDEFIQGAYWPWMNTLDNQEVLVQNCSRLNRIADYKVNKRGDGFLHLAAACGRSKAITTLLDAFPVLRVDSLNEKGETPLLCACRAGQVEVVRTLLERGADASITNPNKETVLHWLVSFEDADIEEIGHDLLSHGAEAVLRVATTTPVSYSNFPSRIDVDHQFPSTPLTWAVHDNRPAIVKFILSSSDDATICLDRFSRYPNAIESAAFYHHVECLAPMIEKLEEKGVGFTFGPLIQAATHAADVFSMIIRHGSVYKARFTETFDYLARKTKNIVLGSGIGPPGSTLLYYAISEAHDVVVEYLLSTITQPSQNEIGLKVTFDSQNERYPLQDGMFHPEHINRACGEDRRTPLLECVRWNRRNMFHLLLRHGANPLAAARNPFASNEVNWTTLHVFALAGHDRDLAIVDDIIASGLAPDGELPATIPAETPLLVAIQYNAFNLASKLLDAGANINALRFGSGLIVSEYEMTVLGHIVSTAAHHSIPRLRFFLSQSISQETAFIVEPERRLSALHRAAMAERDLYFRDSKLQRLPVPRQDYDLANNRDIMYELLQFFSDPELVNMRCRIFGRTALHLAVEAGNADALELLLDRNADVRIADEQDLTPLALGKILLLDEEWRGDRSGLERAVRLLGKCPQPVEDDVAGMVEEFALHDLD